MWRNGNACNKPNQTKQADQRKGSGGVRGCWQVRWLWVLTWEGHAGNSGHGPHRCLLPWGLCLLGALADQGVSCSQEVCCHPVETGIRSRAVWAVSGNGLAWSFPGQKLTEKGFSAIFVQTGVERNGQVTWAKKTRPKIHRVRTFYQKQVKSRWIKMALIECWCLIGLSKNK